MSPINGLKIHKKLIEYIRMPEKTLKDAEVIFLSIIIY